MTGPTFPGFIRIEYKESNAREAFLRDVSDTFTAGEKRSDEFSERIQRAFSDAFGLKTAKSRVQTEMDQVLAQMTSKMGTFTEAARRNLDAAFSGKVSAGGGFDLDVGAAKEAAAIAERRAVVARQLAEATRIAEVAEKNFGQQTRLSIAAAKELAASETQAAAAAKLQADMAERLQVALDKAGISARGLGGANDNAKVSAGQFRAGAQQLGYQISDLGVQLGLAANSANTGKMALMAFSQQTPQIIQAISLMRGAAGGFAGFIAGPWGAALIAAGSLLGTLALAHHDAANASDAHKDAAEDLTKAMDDLHAATVRESRSTQASIQGDIDKANAMRQRAIETRKAAIAQLEATKATLAATRDGLFAGQAGPAAGLAIRSYSNRASELDAQIAAQNAQIAKADEVVRLKRGAQIRQGVSEAFDPSAAAAGKYERTLDKLNAQLRAGRISEAQYRAELTRATEAKNAATEATKRHSKASTERTRAAREEKATQDALVRSYYAGLKAVEAFTAEVTKSLGAGLSRDTDRYWAGVAERQADALGKMTATSQANQDWNDQLRETIGLLDQIGGAGSALGDVGRILGSLSKGNLGALPGAAGIVGKALGGVTWQTVDPDGTRMVRQLGDEFAQVLDNVFGSKGSFAKVLESAGVGVAASQLALGGKGSNIGGMLGGALGEEAGKALFKGVGGMLGKLGGPLGSIAGGILGGALGSAFKKTTSGYAVISNRGTSSGGSNRDLAKGAANTGDSISAQLQSIADRLGGSVGDYSVSIGTRSSGWISVSASGSSQVADKNWKKKNAGGDLIYDGKDAEEAARIALLNAIQDGAVSGIRAGAQMLLKAGKDLDRQVQRALDFEGVFRELKAIKDPTGAALDTLNLEFRRLIDIFKEAGSSATEYAQLEELYNIKRADAVKDANDKILSSLKGLKSYLNIGSDFYSLRDRQASALAAYNPLKARVQAGDATAFDPFTEAAQSLLDIERQISGSTNAFFARADEIRALTDQAIAGKQSVADVAAASDSPFTQLRDQQAQTVSAIDAQTSALIAALENQLGSRLDNINANLIANGRAALAANSPSDPTAMLKAAGYW